MVARARLQLRFMLYPYLLSTTLLQACLEAITKVQRGMSRINIYDIYADVCLPKHNEVTQLRSQLSSNGFNLSSTVAALGTGAHWQALRFGCRVSPPTCSACVTTVTCPIVATPGSISSNFLHCTWQALHFVAEELFVRVNSFAQFVTCLIIAVSGSMYSTPSTPQSILFGHMCMPLALVRCCQAHA